MRYTIHCTDGTDRGCWGELEVEIPLRGLSQQQAQELAEGGRTEISGDQAKLNRLQLDKGEKELIAQGYTILYSFAVSQTVCGACGSDHSYNDEGECVDHE